MTFAESGLGPELVKITGRWVLYFSWAGKWRLYTRATENGVC